MLFERFRSMISRSQILCLPESFLKDSRSNSSPLSISALPEDFDPAEALLMNKQQLSETFQQNRQRLFRTVQTRMDPQLYGRVSAEDVLQEAYIDAEKRLASFNEEKFSPFIWLRLIVMQTLINIHRRNLVSKKRDARRERSQLRHQDSTTGAQLAFQIAASHTSPSEAVIRNEHVQLLAQSLESLSVGDREILTLRHFESLSNKEIAELLEINPKNASIRYMRALKRLQERLGENSDFRTVDFE